MAIGKQYVYVCIFFPKYISQQIAIQEVLEEVDRSLFKKISSTPRHPLYPSVPKTKESSTRIRFRNSQLPRVNTQRFKNSFSTGYFLNKEQLFNVMRILNVKFNASTRNFLSLVIPSAVFKVSVLGFQHVFLLKKQ